MEYIKVSSDSHSHQIQFVMGEDHKSPYTPFRGMMEKNYSLLIQYWTFVGSFSFLFKFCFSFIYCTIHNINNMWLIINSIHLSSIHYWLVTALCLLYGYRVMMDSERIPETVGKMWESSLNGTPVHLHMYTCSYTHSHLGQFNVESAHGMFWEVWVNHGF